MPQPKPPKPIYIADPTERFIEWLADVVFEEIIKDDVKEEETVKSNSTI